MALITATTETRMHLMNCEIAPAPIRQNHTRIPTCNPRLFCTACVYHSAAQPSNDNAVLVVSFDSERWDSSGLHDAALPTRLTCPETGIYLISGSVSFAANATGRRYLDIYLNGNTMLARQINPAAPVGATDLTVSTTYQLNAGDYVELRVLQ
jgi:hypothetical protein